MWRYPCDCEVMGVCEDTTYLLAGQKRPKDHYKDPNVLLKVYKANMAGTVEAIKESCCSDVRAPACIIKKITIIKTYGDYSKHASPNYMNITSMLHFTKDKNKFLLECNVHLVKEHVAEDNRIIYDILDKICKDTEPYPNVKELKFKRDSRVAFYAIHSRWLWPNHVNTTVSEAEAAFQTSTHEREKKAWKWEKYASWYIKYHTILENLMECGYQGLDLGLKVWYLLNGIRCDKFFTAVAAVNAHKGKYEEDVDILVASIM